MTRYVGGHEPARRRRPYLWAGLATLVAITVGATAAYGTGAIRSDSHGAVACPSGNGALLYPDGTWSCTALPVGGQPTSSSAPGTTAAGATAPGATTSGATAPGSTAPGAKPTASGSSSSSGGGTPHTSAAPAGSAHVIQAYTTAYSWFDNTPAGSSSISNPVLHQTAGGTGTYADPITVAVGHSITGGRDVLDWPAGTRFYIPNLRRYFIVEDTCGDGGTPQNGPCHTGYPASASTWLDLWAGGQGGTSSGADKCMNAVTRVTTVVVDPASTYPVVAGDVYGAAGCTQQFGDALA